MRDCAALALSAFAIAILLAAPLAAQDRLSADGDTPGTRIEIQDIKRDEGGTVTLRFQMVNESDDKFGDRCAFRENSGEGCGPISGVHLLDVPNKKKYLVVRDSKQKCVCNEIAPIKAGGRMNFWAKFPAPPASVQKVTVIVPHFQPIEGVPVTNR